MIRLLPAPAYATVAASFLIIRSPFTMRLRRLHRRFGIAAPRLVIRNAFPWAWILATSVLWLGVLLISHWLDEAADHADASALRQEIQKLQTEIGELRVRSQTAGSSSQMEKATQQQLAQRVQALEKENLALKEDIRLFERLIPQSGEEGKLRIDSTQITREGNAYRYRAVFGYRPSKQAPLFRGRLQLAVQMKDGSTLLLPERERDQEAFLIEVRHFTRREGRFELPSNAQPLRVEFRIYQGDTLRSEHEEPL